MGLDLGPGGAKSRADALGAPEPEDGAHLRGSDAVSALGNALQEVEPAPAAEHFSVGASGEIGIGLGLGLGHSVRSVPLRVCRGNSESFVPSPGDPDKPARACLAVDEATPLAMGAADRRECGRTMRGWYAETWYPRPDPADACEGEAQLRYLRVKALECRRAADAYRLAGKDRWHALMRCLVVVRKR